MSRDDKLGALKHLSEDFPKYSAAIARKIPITQDMRGKGVSISKRGVATPQLYINGKAYRDVDLNPLSSVSSFPIRPKLSSTGCSILFGPSAT